MRSLKRLIFTALVPGQLIKVNRHGFNDPGGRGGKLELRQRSSMASSWRSLSLGKLVFMDCAMMKRCAAIYCTTMQIFGRAVNGQAHCGNIAKTLSPTAASQVSRMALVGGRGGAMDCTAFWLVGFCAECWKN